MLASSSEIIGRSSEPNWIVTGQRSHRMECGLRLSRRCRGDDQAADRFSVADGDSPNSRRYSTEKRPSSVNPR